MCKVILLDQQKRVAVLQVHGVKYAVTKECMPKEMFEKCFPDENFEKWEHIPREKVLMDKEVEQTVRRLKIGTLNCNIHKLN